MVFSMLFSVTQRCTGYKRIVTLLGTTPAKQKAKQTKMSNNFGVAELESKLDTFLKAREQYEYTINRLTSYILYLEQKIRKLEEEDEHTNESTDMISTTTSGSYSPKRSREPETYVEDVDEQPAAKKLKVEEKKQPKFIMWNGKQYALRGDVKLLTGLKEPGHRHKIVMYQRDRATSADPFILVGIDQIDELKKQNDTITRGHFQINVKDPQTGEINRCMRLYTIDFINFLIERENSYQEE